MRVHERPSIKVEGENEPDYDGQEFQRGPSRKGPDLNSKVVTSLSNRSLILVSNKNWG